MILESGKKQHYLDDPPANLQLHMLVAISSKYLLFLSTPEFNKEKFMPLQLHSLGTADMRNPKYVRATPITASVVYKI